MVDVRMMYGTDDGEAVTPLRELGEVLADPDTVDVSPDLSERATVAFRGIRFHVPGVHLGRAAPHEEQDGPLGPTERSPLAGEACRSGTASEQVRERRPGQRQRPRPQNLPAGSDL
jgi:hypothetical protein